MTKEQLYRAMSLIDDKYIAESMTEYRPKMSVWVKRSLATAAVLVLVFAAAIGVMSGGFMAKGDANNAFDPEANAPTLNPGGNPNAGSPDIGNPETWLTEEVLIDLDAIVGISGEITVGQTVSTGGGMITVESFYGNSISAGATNVDISEIGVLVFYGTSKGYYAEAGAHGANTDRDGLERFDTEYLAVDISVTPDGQIEISLDNLIESGKTPTIIYLHAGSFSYRLELNTAK